MVYLLANPIAPQRFMFFFSLFTHIILQSSYVTHNFWKMLTFSVVHVQQGKLGRMWPARSGRRDRHETGGDTLLHSC